MSSPFDIDTRPKFSSFGPFSRTHVFRLSEPESSEEISSWPFGFSSVNSREKIDTSSAEDGEGILRETLGRDTEPLGKALIIFICVY